MNLSNNKILITGGASGIGLGLTERFIQEDNIVIICGRREEVLKEAAKKYPTVITRVCDLSIEAERINLFNWISENHPDLNILINNAGIQNWMEISEADFINKTHAEINTNIIAPVHLSHLFLNLQSLTTIINVTSALSFVPLTKVPIYCGTKAFLHSFTQSMRHLLQNNKIEIIEIIPPALNTDLGGKGLHDEFPPVSDFINAIFEQLKEGKDELTFGLSDVITKASPSDIKNIFNRMNS